MHTVARTKWRERFLFDTRWNTKMYSFLIAFVLSECASKKFMVASRWKKSIELCSSRWMPHASAIITNTCQRKQRLIHKSYQMLNCRFVLLTPAADDDSFFTSIYSFLKRSNSPQTNRSSVVILILTYKFKVNWIQYTDALNAPKSVQFNIDMHNFFQYNDIYYCWAKQKKWIISHAWVMWLVLLLSFKLLKKCVEKYVLNSAIFKFFLCSRHIIQNFPNHSKSYELFQMNNLWLKFLHVRSPK